MISPYYDSMIAKLIVHAATREEAVDRMLKALDVCVLEGVKNQCAAALRDPLRG